MDSNYNTIDGLVRSVTANGIAEIDQQDFLILKTAARQFLESVEIISQQQESIISKGYLKDRLTRLYKYMREETAYSQQMITFQHDFEVALNNFLGRTIYLTYVADDGNILYLGDAHIAELYKTGTANKGRLNISGRNIQDINDLQEELKEEFEKSRKNKVEVYQTALRRYRKNNNPKTKMHYNNGHSEKTFYWWNVYHKRIGGYTEKIVNEGPIAEGFVGVVINDDPHISNSDIEGSLKVFAQHIGKDSIGAALKGDVVYDKDGRLQFAVKKGNFSTAKIGQYIRLAYNILQLNQLTAEELSQPDVFAKLTRNSKATDAIIENINNRVIEDIQNAIKFDTE